MKKLFSTILVAIVATVASYAQTIAVVSSSGSTTMYQDFGKAVNEAKDGSTIYLPGGGFQLNDTIRIKHKVTIMGVSHRADTDNAEGATTIAGNVWFNQGSDGSAVMGCYVSGDVHVGEDAAVTNILLRYCNINSVQVMKSECVGISINQNYIRKASNFGGSNPKITNNVLYTFEGVNGGIIKNNIVTGNYYLHVIAASNSNISYNIFFRQHGGATNNGFCAGGDNMGLRNMYFDDRYDYAAFDEKIVLEDGVTQEDVFVKPTFGISPLSDFHFTEKYKQYSDIGIYGGSGFDDQALAPIPRIISKEIPEQTDAEGKLNIKITVKSGSNSAKGTSGNDSSGSGTSGNGTSGNGAGGGGTNRY